MISMHHQKEEDKLIGQGCTTYSKKSSQYVGTHPTHIIESNGCSVLGNNMKWYIDTSCGLGSNLIDIRNNYGKPSILEPIAAHELIKKFKFLKKVKFLKTGSAACDAALRYARAVTKRNVVFGTGYHGCGNDFISQEFPGLGCVNTGYKKFNTIQEILVFLDKTVAAVIIEPLQLFWNEEYKQLLKDLRKKCTETGTILIFDEVITGLRVPGFSVSNWWEITPDLICLGKAIANGFPLAVLGSTSDLLDLEGVFISNTHNGEESSLQACLETLKKWSSYNLRILWERGGRFQKEINDILPKDKLQLVGYNTRGEWRGDLEYHAKFCEIMEHLGILIGKGWFITLAHETQEIHKILKAAQRAVNQIEKGYELKTYVPQPIFKRN